MLKKGVFEHVSATITFDLNDDFAGNWTVVDHKLPYAIEEGSENNQSSKVAASFYISNRNINRSWLQSFLVWRKTIWSAAAVLSGIRINL